MQTPNGSTQRRSNRLASRHDFSSSSDPTRPKNSASELNQESSPIISRPKKKRYSVDQNELPADSLDVGTCQAVVQISSNLLKRRNAYTCEETIPESPLQQNFKQFRKKSLTYERTSSLESLENSHISLILTSPELNESVEETGQASKTNSKKRISDFFKKESYSPLLKDGLSKLDDSVVELEDKNGFVPLQRTIKMVDFSELFKNANLDFGDRTT